MDKLQEYKSQPKSQQEATQKEENNKQLLIEEERQKPQTKQEDAICVCQLKYLGRTDNTPEIENNFHDASEHVDVLTGLVVSLCTHDFKDTQAVRKKIYQHCEILMKFSKMSLFQSGFVDLASVVRNRHLRLQSAQVPDEASVKCLHTHSMFVLSALRMYGLPMLEALFSFCKDHS